MYGEGLRFMYNMTLSPKSFLPSVCFKGEPDSCFFYILPSKPVFTLIVHLQRRYREDTVGKCLLRKPTNIVLP